MLELRIWIEGEKPRNEFELLTAMAGTVTDRFGPAVRYEVSEEPDFPAQFTEVDFPTEEARQVFLDAMDAPAKDIPGLRDLLNRPTVFDHQGEHGYGEDEPDAQTRADADNAVSIGGITYATGDFDRADLSANHRIGGRDLDERA